MNRCAHCQKTFEPTRDGQRFCRGRCRSAWHRANNLPGQVTGIRAIKHGWSITVRYPAIPPGICKGTAVMLETDGVPRPDASTGADNA